MAAAYITYISSFLRQSIIIRLCVGIMHAAHSTQYNFAAKLRTICEPVFLIRSDAVKSRLLLSEEQKDVISTSGLSAWNIYLLD